MTTESEFFSHTVFPIEAEIFKLQPAHRPKMEMWQSPLELSTSHPMSTQKFFSFSTGIPKILLSSRPHRSVYWMLVCMAQFVKKSMKRSMIMLATMLQTLISVI